VHGELALFGTVVFHADEPHKVWFAGGALDPWTLRDWHDSRYLEHADLPAEAWGTTWLSGCSVLVPRAAYERIGAWDERYFLYEEDVDWSLRARKAGIARLMVPDACVLHQGSASVRKLDPALVRYYAWRNHYLLAWSHGGLARRGAVATGLAWCFLKIAFRSASPQWRHDHYYQARTAGLVDLVKGRLGRSADFDPASCLVAA
jgi:GT2 family glycosyltransferase